jgi:adenine C2-methylase RlmN of 23S rRNA A2503 and tRNA A37
MLNYKQTKNIPLFGNTLEELVTIAEGAGLPKFTGQQLADWLYKKNINGHAYKKCQ